VGGGGLVIGRQMCVLIFSTTLFEAFLILRIIQQDTITNAHRSSCKVPVIRVGFYLNFNFLDIISKKILKYQIP
jgi:Na+/alanine symporter